MRRRSVWPALVVAILSMGCSGKSSETIIPTTTLPGSVSAHCDQIGSQVIKDFVAAFNAGGIDLDQFFASGREFQWYSDDKRIGQFGTRGWTPIYEPYDRTTLIAYLDEARNRGPMTINSLTFTAYRALDQATGYYMMMEWENHLRQGKASVHCGLGQIIVWSLGFAET